jgi:hypothetical protein
MPNGETGRNGWLHRRNETLVKVAVAVVIPVTAWLLLTVIGHSEELSAKGVDLNRTSLATEQAVQERHSIALKLSALEERQLQQQRSNDSAHARQDLKLDRQDEKLDQVLEVLRSAR